MRAAHAAHIASTTAVRVASQPSLRRRWCRAPPACCSPAFAPVVELLLQLRFRDAPGCAIQRLEQHQLARRPAPPVIVPNARPGRPGRRRNAPWRHALRATVLRRLSTRATNSSMVIGLTRQSSGINSSHGDGRPPPSRAVRISTGMSRQRRQPLAQPVTYRRRQRPRSTPRRRGTLARRHRPARVAEPRAAAGAAGGQCVASCGSSSTTGNRSGLRRVSRCYLEQLGRLAALDQGNARWRSPRHRADASLLVSCSRFRLGVGITRHRRPPRPASQRARRQQPGLRGAAALRRARRGFSASVRGMGRQQRGRRALQRGPDFAIKVQRRLRVEVFRRGCAAHAEFKPTALPRWRWPAGCARPASALMPYSSPDRATSHAWPHVRAQLEGLEVQFRAHFTLNLIATAISSDAGPMYHKTVTSERSRS